MPELPEVETIKRQLQKRLRGETILDVKVFFEKIIFSVSDSTFIKDLKKQRVQEISRRGKYLIFKLTDYYMLVHLRMSGKFLIKEKDSINQKHEHIHFIFNNFILAYHDVRKFGRIYLVKDPSIILDKLGIEPLSEKFTLLEFKKILKGTKSIKAFLLDQSEIAGLGNIYVDEALFLAKIAPKRLISAIYDDEAALLHHAIIKVLKKGIDNMGTSLGKGKSNYKNIESLGKNQNELLVFNRENEPCINCKNPIKKIRVAQRGTHYCPFCQK